MPQKNKPNGQRRRDERAEEREHRTSPSLSPDTTRSIVVVVLFLISVIFIFSLFELAGTAGIYIDRGLTILMGWGKWISPPILLVLGFAMLFPAKYTIRGVNYLGLFFFVLSFSGLLHVFVPIEEATTVIGYGRGGGYFGLFLYLPLQRVLGLPATIAVLLAIFLISILLVFSTSLHDMAARSRTLRSMVSRLPWRRSSAEEPMAVQTPLMVSEEEKRSFTKRVIDTARRPGVQTAMTVEEDDKHKRHLVKRRVDLPFDLLEANGTKPESGRIEENKEKIQKTLANFGIAVEMYDVNVGPTVTQYTLKPDEGVKLNQITTLQNDLALALAAHPIRIEAPIPGKSLVGIEIPNQKVAIVRMREILEGDMFKKRSSNLMVALGKDVSGRPLMANLDTMPHLLIAGATGSGKSVCINAMILSLLFQNTPETLRLILVDPKRVELTVYNGIPQLYTPVITEVKKTVNALHWAIAEMDRRYKELSAAGKRNVHLYNAEAEFPMPFIVIIIDELADLMMAASHDVEASIIRLAQMARAVGIHLIVATQRPSVDVITGLIKANITSRIAFNVASLVDSRTILDSSGAEKLLGRGDMLFESAEISKPRRIQGAFVSEKEIENVVERLKKDAGDVEYHEEITERHASIPGLQSSGEDGEDDLLDEAKEVVVRAGKASASLLQRRLRVGYARAARLLDILEERGVIGPADGARPREILVKEVDGAEVVSPDDEVDDSSDFNDNEDTLSEEDRG